MTLTMNKRPVQVRSSPAYVNTRRPRTERARGLSGSHARVTRVDSDPSDDQAAAELRDPDRLIELGCPTCPLTTPGRPPTGGKPVKAMLTESGDKQV